MSVLGPVEVRGAARPFRRSGSLELVVYLALHPGPVGNDRWATALWPERVPAPPTRHSVASAARQALGRSAEGRDHLPHSHGHLALAPTVGSDWGRFQALAASGHEVGAERALALVRGTPFAGLRGADWTVFEGCVAEIEEAVGRLAAGVAERALLRGRPEVARSAARRGLLASPFDERLHRLLMRAADLEGNPAGVRRAMSDLLGILGEPRVGSAPGPGEVSDGGEAAALVHPETFLLYRTLVGTRTGAPGPAVAAAQRPGPAPGAPLFTL